VSWQPAATTGPVGCDAACGGADLADGDAALAALALCRCFGLAEGEGDADGDGVADAVVARGDRSAVGREAGAVPQAQATIAGSRMAAAVRTRTGTRADTREMLRRCVAPGRRSAAIPPAAALRDAASTRESFPIVAG